MEDARGGGGEDIRVCIEGVRVLCLEMEVERRWESLELEFSAMASFHGKESVLQWFFNFVFILSVFCFLFSVFCNETSKSKPKLYLFYFRFFFFF